VRVFSPEVVQVVVLFQLQTLRLLWVKHR
jgi:hypothetical protein